MFEGFFIFQCLFLRFKVFYFSNFDFSMFGYSQVFFKQICVFIFHVGKSVSTFLYLFRMFFAQGFLKISRFSLASMCFCVQVLIFSKVFILQVLYLQVVLIVQCFFCVFKGVFSQGLYFPRFLYISMFLMLI